MALSENGLKTWITFLRTYSKVQARLAEDMHCQHQIPLSWYDVLVHLYHAPRRGMRMQDLADAVILSSSGLTRLLDRMIEAGFVERVSCAEDRRVIYATLTPQGSEAIEEILPGQQARIEHYFAQYLTDVEMDTIQQGLQRVLEGLQAEKKERLMG